MTAVAYDGEALVPSYPTSPKPRRQPMTPLRSNQRSYSRVSSKGLIGDESPLILSPMPKYPNRRRSITFADETEATVREERPYYTVPDMGATPNKRYSESPARRPILKNRLGENTIGMSNITATTTATTTNNTTAASSGEHHISGEMVETGGISTTTMFSGSLTPRRGRSNSRQRRAVRRKQAEQQYGFYDDSMVEEYVLRARKELEMEEEERLEEKLRQQEKEKEEAENKAAQATLKINALQQAKEYLLSSTNTRNSSPAFSSTERDCGKNISRSHQVTPKKELIPLQGREKNKENLEIEGQFELMRKNVKKSMNRSMPLVASVNETDDNCSRKRIRQSSSKKVEHSVPVGHIDYANGDDMGNSRIVDSEEDDEETAKRKKNKLERIIARVIEQQAKRRHGKRSVVVIDWDSEASEGIPGAVEENEEYDDDDNVENEYEIEEEREKINNKKGEKQELPVKAPSRQRKPPSVKKNTVDTVRVGVQRQTKPPPPAAAASTRSVTVREPSTRKRNVSVSVAPDLGEDSLLLEEDQPVLLRRPTTKRRAPTRSISYISADADDNSIFDQGVDVSRKPPQRAPAPKVTRRGRKAATTGAGLSPASIPASSPPLSATNATSASGNSRAFTSVHPGAYITHEAVASLPPSTATAVAAHQTTRGRRGAAARPPIPEVSPADPMAVFFGADFPSPSKFEEMLQAAGGLPEARRVGRGHQRQPALLLPDTIARRR
ncbi:hypothetical protein LSM04_007857 [Trypanosoma melophagium]|uniref:uncharacterized protein n=1 Tax=Trypanosoma melophagium TaxID=715481 RepID=UPI003519DC08|nr:hypothetical protein LSM04_007857 [Trypanosoma melophagium]